MIMIVGLNLSMFYVLSNTFNSVSCLVKEAGALSASCDMAEELSRQLEDILSTYCHEDGGSEDAAVTNGQPDGVDVNGLSEKEDGKQEENKLNGNGCVDKDQKKVQEKKKVKGLGECQCPTYKLKVLHLISQNKHKVKFC